MYFDDRSAAHAMMRGKTCTTSPSLRAVPLHAHYEALFHGSVFTEHDAVRHVTRGTFTDYDSFLAAALADPTHGWMVACTRDAHFLLMPNGSMHAGVP